MRKQNKFRRRRVWIIVEHMPLGGYMGEVYVDKQAALGAATPGEHVVSAILEYNPRSRAVSAGGSHG